MGRGALFSLAGVTDEAPPSAPGSFAEAAEGAVGKSAFPSFRKARETASAPSSARAFPAAA